MLGAQMHEMLYAFIIFVDYALNKHYKRFTSVTWIARFDVIPHFDSSQLSVMLITLMDYMIFASIRN